MFINSMEDYNICNKFLLLVARCNKTGLQNYAYSGSMHYHILSEHWLHGSSNDAKPKESRQTK